MINIRELGPTIREIERLHKLTQPENGNARWDALQDAMKTNPKLRSLVKNNLNRPAGEVFNSLMAEYGIEPAMLGLIDSQGVLRGKVETIITTIQTLYKERQNA